MSETRRKTGWPRNGNGGFSVSFKTMIAIPACVLLLGLVIWVGKGYVSAQGADREKMNAHIIKDIEETTGLKSKMTVVVEDVAGIKEDVAGIKKDMNAQALTLLRMEMTLNELKNR